MITALIKRKEQLGLEWEQRAIQKINKSTIFVLRGATSTKGIIKIDKELLKKCIESERYGE